MQSQKYISVLVCLLVWLSLAFSLPNSANAQARRYEIKCSAKLWKASFDTCKAQIGVTEKTGNNDGVHVEAYLRSVGLSKGNPYCYAGQYWSFKQAAARFQESVKLLKSGLASAAFNYAAKTGVRTNPQPQIMDLIFWKFSGKVFGHAARIMKIKLAGWIETIEFNTSSGTSGNQRDGGGVFTRLRNIYYPLGRMSLSGYVGYRESITP